MSLVFSPELEDYCLINQATSAPPSVHSTSSLSGAVTAALPVPPIGIDEVTQQMRNTSIGPAPQVDGQLSDDDALPGDESEDEGDISRLISRLIPEIPRTYSDLRLGQRFHGV
jgi:hypothetical protein